MAARDFLQRFRPAGAPGGAGPVGVPVDAARRVRELDPVFEALEPDLAECDAIRAEGEVDAAAVLARSDEDAQRRIVAARLRAGEVRVAAATRARLDADAAAAALIATARADAFALIERGRTRIPGLAERIVALVRAGPP